MKYQKLILLSFLIVVFLLAINSFVAVGAFDSSKVNPDVYSAFDSGDEVRVVVILEDGVDEKEFSLLNSNDQKEIVKDLQEEFLDDLSNEVDVFGDSDEEKKLVVNRETSVKNFAEDKLEKAESGLIQLDSNEENLLEEVGDSDVVVVREFEQTGAIALEVSDESAIDEILNLDNVAKVLIDPMVSITLDSSVPLINANQTWTYDTIGDGTGNSITGIGETVCVIDTGIDYTHPALGGCNISTYDLIGDVHDLETSVESEHPYGHSMDETYTINMSGFDNIALHFSEINLSGSIPYENESFDEIYIYNEENETIAIYQGEHYDIWTPSSPGSIMYVRFVTNSYYNSRGFVVDQAINGTTNNTLNWSSCSKVIGGYDIYNNDIDPIDDHSHGTHAAGIVASTDSTYVGVAPGASLLALKAMSSTGNGFVSDVAAAMEWCISNSENYNVSVISMSLGDGSAYNTNCDDTSIGQIMKPLFTLANSKNISVLVANGNNGSSSGYVSGISAPACVTGAIPIGSTTSDDEISSFSSVGNLSRLVAPGSSIYAPVLSGAFGYKSGTSMATPHVAGAIALMNQYAKAAYGHVLTPSEIEDKLVLTGVNVDDTENSGLNYSRIDVLAAIKPVLNYTAGTAANGSETYGGEIFVNVSSDVNLSNAILELNNGDFTNYSLDFNGFIGDNYYYSYVASNLSNGNYSFIVYGFDLLNTSSQTDSRWVQVLSNTTVTISAPGDVSYHKNNFTFLASVSSSDGLNNSNYTVYNLTDGSVVEFGENDSLLGNSLNWSKEIDVNGSYSEGNYSLVVFAKDSAGEEVNDSITFVVDFTAPLIGSLVYSPTTIYTNDSILFEVNASDAAMDINETVIEIDTKNGLENFTMSYVSSELFNLTFEAFGNVSGGDNVSAQVYAYDLAGNEANNSLLYFFVENRPLINATITVPANTSTIELGNETIFTATAYDLDNDSVFTYYWDFNESNNTATGNNAEYTFVEEGTYFVTVNVSDYNSSAYTSATVYVNDTTAPNITSISWGEYSIHSGDVQNATVTLLAFDLSNFSEMNLYDHNGTLIDIYSESFYEDTSEHKRVWKFGDYVAAGTYDFTVELVDNSSNLNYADNYSGNVTVTMISDAPSESSSTESSSSSGGGGGGGSSYSVASSSDDVEESEISISDSDESGSSLDGDSSATGPEESSENNGEGSESLNSVSEENNREESLFSRTFGEDGLTGAIVALDFISGTTLVGILAGFVVLLAVLYFIVKPKGGY